MGVMESFVEEEPSAPETPTEPAEPAEPETTAEPAPQQQAQSPITPISRRTQAKQDRDALLNEIKSLRESVTKQGETYAEKLSRIERENAELRGAFQGYMSRPAETQQSREPDADPAKLRREARQALDNKDFDEYERLSALAIKTEVMRDVLPKIPQQQQAASKPMNPMLQMVASGYMDVVTNQAALTIAQAHDNILAAQGIPESPDRWKRAFDEGRRYLGGKAKPQAQFSQSSREVLSQVPTARSNAPGAGSGEPGVRLTSVEKDTARKFKVSEEDYAKELAAMHPERIER